jgi:toxin ParE1/3/4
MAKVSWTTLALEDLKEIHSYISKDSKFYADRFTAKLIQRVDVLIAFPLSGRIVPEKDDESIRELIEGNYRIFYKLESAEVLFIIRIHHAAMKII